MLFHGYGGSKIQLAGGGGGIGDAIDSMQPWLERGLRDVQHVRPRVRRVVRHGGQSRLGPGERVRQRLQPSARHRYEVRDAEWFAGELADAGLASPTQIAAVGGSYGGGMSMALAALKNRVMLPSGKLAPWRSPDGRKMQIAAAAPFIPWTDLSYSLVPNGCTLDYVADAPYRGRYGVMKLSFVSALYASGCGTPTTFCTTSQPDWNLGAWFKRLKQGEPYTGSQSSQILHQVSTYPLLLRHRSFQPPAPLLIANGWTDDLFPVDEALRYYNRTTTQYPKTPISLFFGDWGHPRAQNKAADIARYVAGVHSWLDYYLRGTGRKPFQGVQSLTETCRATAVGRPYRAANWARLEPGEVRLNSPAAQTILPTAGSTRSAPRSTRCTERLRDRPRAPTQRGSATYRAEPQARVHAARLGDGDRRLHPAGRNSQVAARLLDVAPNGKETLVAAGCGARRSAAGRCVRCSSSIRAAGSSRPVIR